MATVSTNIDIGEIIALGGDPSMPIDVIEVETWSTYEATITRIRAIVERDVIEVSGTAKRSPQDKYDPKVGMLLATSRAYYSLAQAVYKRVNGHVDHNDHIKQMRPQQLERSAIWHEKVIADKGMDTVMQDTAFRAAAHAEDTEDIRT